MFLGSATIILANEGVKIKNKHFRKPVQEGLYIIQQSTAKDCGEYRV